MDEALSPDAETLRLRQLFERKLHGLAAESRVAFALKAEEPVLSALCFDPLPAVATQLLNNARFGLHQARLLAAHHPHPRHCRRSGRGKPFSATRKCNVSCCEMCSSR